MIPIAPPHSALPETYLLDQRKRRRALAIALTASLLATLACTATLVTQPLARPSGAPPAPALDTALLEQHVRQLSETCLPRSWDQLEGLERAATYITEVFQASGARLDAQTFSVRNRSYRNVLASYGPETGPRIIVGAHYDACGPLPGADDNASGVAGLLALGQLLGRQPPRHRVDLVAYTLEEPPFFRTSDMGSAHHARLMKEARSDVQAVIVLEMIGRFTDAKGSQRYPSMLLEPFYPDRGDFITVVGRFGDIGLTRSVKRAMRGASPLPVRSINGPRWIPGLDFSDHHPYWDQGFKAVMVTDTSFYRNQDYHTLRDTPDRLDYVRMAQVVQGVHAAVRELEIRAH